MPPLELDSLYALAAPQASGKPLSIAVDLIDEDPTQPRSEFDADVLQELADSITARGVLQPVSVRPHPTTPGRWILNFGARRLRASKLAGKAEIPVFVDEQADDFDQVIENEQREALRPIELALFVKGQLAAGVSQLEIARRLGKSSPYVSYVCALIDPPDWLMTLYRAGRCRGVKELYDLRRLHGSKPEVVAHWLKGRECVSRGDIAELREQCMAGTSADSGRTPTLTPLRVEVLQKSAREPGRVADAGTARPAVESAGSCQYDVVADLKGQRVRVVLDRAPRTRDEVFLMSGHGEPLTTAHLSDLKQIGLLRRSREIKRV